MQLADYQNCIDEVIAVARQTITTKLTNSKMAVLKKLEDQLNCSICLDTYTNPKQLQCHHVYCQQCLVRLVIRDQQGQLSLTCPNCRQVTPVPANGVAGLQAAFRVNKLLEIVEEHKKVKVATASPEESENAIYKPHSTWKHHCRLP